MGVQYLQFGKKLKTLMADCCLTVSGLAKKMGVSESTIDKWRRGEALPRIDKLPRLAEILGVTINDLLADEGKEPSDCRPLFKFSDIATCLDGRKDYCKTCRMITCRLVRHNRQACAACINQNSCMKCRFETERHNDYRVNHQVRPRREE